MSLEAANFVSELVATNPESDDDRSQGDDHLRLIKAILQGTFPNASRAFYFDGGVAKTGDYDVLISDENKTIFADATGGVVDFDLPVVGLFSGFNFKVTKTDATANAVTLTPDSGTINGAASLSIGSQFGGATVIWTGSTWIAFRFFSNSISGDVTILDDLTVVGETVFEEIVTFEQGIEFDGPLQIDGAADFNAAVNFNDSVVFGDQTLTDGANVDWNMGLQPYAKWTAAGSRTVNAPTGETEGQLCFLLYIQDAAGSRIPAWNAAYKGVGGTVPRPGLTANEQTLYLAYVRGADDILMVRLWTSLHRQPEIYNDVDMGDFAANTTYTHTHNLGYMPKVEVFLKITTTESGYTANDYVPIWGVGDGDTSSRIPTLKVNGTDAKLKTSSAAGTIQEFSSNSPINITTLATAPKVIFRVWE